MLLTNNGSNHWRYWFVRKGKLSTTTPTVKWKARGLIALAAGFVVGIFCTYVFSIPLTGVICAAVSFIVDIVIGKLAPEKENVVTA